MRGSTGNQMARRLEGNPRWARDAQSFSPEITEGTEIRRLSQGVCLADAGFVIPQSGVSKTDALQADLGQQPEMTPLLFHRRAYASMIVASHERCGRALWQSGQAVSARAA